MKIQPSSSRNNKRHSQHNSRPRLKQLKDNGKRTKNEGNKPRLLLQKNLSKPEKKRYSVKKPNKRLPRSWKRSEDEMAKPLLRIRSAGSCRKPRRKNKPRQKQ